ncbi:hypothetical protein J6590_043855 [Homalodisca vitripennis]|nr:hypothetical protein J6590_043855 [Homalodisca vitripennis]
MVFQLPQNRNGEELVNTNGIVFCIEDAYVTYSTETITAIEVVTVHSVISLRAVLTIQQRDSRAYPATAPHVGNNWQVTSSGVVEYSGGYRGVGGGGVVTPAPWATPYCSQCSRVAWSPRGELIIDHGVAAGHLHCNMRPRVSIAVKVNCISTC